MIESAALDSPTIVPTSPIAELLRVRKAYDHSGQSVAVLEDFSLAVQKGQFLTVFGPNGCGKTTLLNIIAGLLSPDSGSVTRQGANRLDVGFVFQDYADTLLPWRTVRGNIEFPLELRRVPRRERKSKVRDHLLDFSLQDHEYKFAYELSGGLKQLVAIARATVYDPVLLLLDEPFSALDHSISRTLWLRLREFCTDRNLATVFVSHNVDEAIFLGDKVCVLSAKPANVVAEVPVPFGSDRHLSLLSSVEFFSLRSQVLSAFERGRTA